MCGIFAAIAPKGHPACRFASRAVCLLKHRGPDAQGTLHVELPQASITLGMSRLKIVDQNDIPVPFDFRDNHGIVLAFNGEIYNWLELRNGIHCRWTTSCDAEVLAALWRLHGPACLDKLNGMFAFVLVDTLRNEVFVVRDRAGEKPVYWTERSGITYVASEPKALPVELASCHCADMDVLEFDCAESTPLRDVFALPPGSLLHLIKAHNAPVPSGEPNITRWWKLPEPTRQEVPDEYAGLIAKQALVDEAEALIVDAIKLRYISERPVAVQFSGGLDSAIVQAVCHSERLYCIDFTAEGVNNITAAQLAAKSVSVQAVTFSREDLLDALPKAAYHLDTPATWTAVCQWYLNEYIATDGNVVVLSGEGADELFGGYSRYRILHWIDRMIADPHLEHYGPLIERTFGGALETMLTDMLNRGGHAARHHANHLLCIYSGGRTKVDLMSHTDFYTTLQVLLRMADRMAAAFSLENRSPFFDYRVMEFAARLPSSLKVTDNESKAILRCVARHVGVPESIIRERTKKGLFVPPSWGIGKKWDREWFNDAMLDAWREACLRPALCESCEGRP